MYTYTKCFIEVFKIERMSQAIKKTIEGSLELQDNDMNSKCYKLFQKNLEVFKDLKKWYKNLEDFQSFKNIL